jgi:hypothetical protein
VALVRDDLMAMAQAARSLDISGNPVRRLIAEETGDTVSTPLDTRKRVVHRTDLERFRREPRLEHILEIGEQ